MNTHCLLDVTFFSNKLLGSLVSVAPVGEEMPADRQMDKEPASTKEELGRGHLLILTMPVGQCSFPPGTTGSWLWFRIGCL